MNIDSIFLFHFFPSQNGWTGMEGRGGIDTTGRIVSSLSSAHVNGRGAEHAFVSAKKIKISRFHPPM